MSTPDSASVPDTAKDATELKLMITNMNMRGKDNMIHIPINPIPILYGLGMSGCVRLRCKNAQNSIACPKQKSKFNMSTTSENDSHPRQSTPEADNRTP